MAKVTVDQYLASAVRVQSYLGASSISLGGTTRVKLDPIGLITSILAKVTLNITISTSPASLSPIAPYNFVTGIRLTDTTGIDRVSCPGHLLWALNCLRKKTIEYGDTGVMFSSPSLPTSIGTHTITFFLDIPVSYRDDDLKGALRADVSGDIYIAFDWATTLVDNGNSESVYNGSSTSSVTLNSGSVELRQRYLQSSLTLPDVTQLIHYIEGNLRITDGLVANTERLISYPTSRAIVGAGLVFLNNGAMNESDLGTLRFVTGPSEVFRYDNETAYAVQRDMLYGSTLPQNVLILRHDLPVETRLTRQNQIGFTPASAVAGNTFLGVAFEGFALS